MGSMHPVQVIAVTGGNTLRCAPYALFGTQALSDQAQLHTIAFSGLAFLTGDFASDTFLPPGKVSDYFGFQYMRDIDTASGGKLSQAMAAQNAAQGGGEAPAAKPATKPAKK